MTEQIKNIFPDGEYPSIGINRSLLDSYVRMPSADAKAACKSTWADCEEIKWTDDTPLKLGFGPADKKPEKITLVFESNDKTVVVFSSTGFTNFGFHDLPLTWNNEMFFQTAKAALCNNNDVMEKILKCDEPSKAKDIPGKEIPRDTFPVQEWNQVSPMVMGVTVLRNYLDENNFNAAKRILKVIGKDALIIEGNKFDATWGAKIDALTFRDNIMKVFAEAEAPQDLDLHAEAEKLCNGKNILGKILMHVMKIIAEVSFEEYTKAIGALEFFTTIEDVSVVEAVEKVEPVEACTRKRFLDEA